MNRLGLQVPVISWNNSKFIFLQVEHVYVAARFNFCGACKIWGGDVQGEDQYANHEH